MAWALSVVQSGKSVAVFDSTLGRCIVSALSLVGIAPLLSLWWVRRGVEKGVVGGDPRLRRGGVDCCDAVVVRDVVGHRRLSPSALLPYPYLSLFHWLEQLVLGSPLVALPLVGIPFPPVSPHSPSLGLWPVPPVVACCRVGWLPWPP